MSEIADYVSKHVNPKYVKNIAQNGDIYYTDEFYDAMYQQTEILKTSAREAYEALGFDTQALSEARAHSARARAIRRMEKKKVFKKNPATVDSDITFEQMMKRYIDGDIEKDELYANMAARLIVLEEIHSGLKKTISSSNVEATKQELIPKED